jgi:hypothetical protein
MDMTSTRESFVKQEEIPTLCIATMDIIVMACPNGCLSKKKSQMLFIA